MNNVVTRYNNYFNSYEKTYDESALHEKEGYDPNQFKIEIMGYQNGWNQKMILKKKRGWFIILILTWIKTK